jgi:hypothetical protein
MDKQQAVDSGTNATKPIANNKTTAATQKNNQKTKADLIEKIKPVIKKYKVLFIIALIAIIAIAVVIFLLTKPISKDEAAQKFSSMMNQQNSLAVDVKNDAKVLDIEKLQQDAGKMVNTLDENIQTINDTKWPEGLSNKAKRLSGENLSDMDILVEDLEKEKEYYKKIAESSEEETLKSFNDNLTLGISDTDTIRKKLGLPSAASEKKNYHEYTEDEVTKKLQENAVEITLGKFNIECKTEYGYTNCKSSMDTAVRNKSKINFTNGGSIDVTAYDQSGNPIDSDTIYLGNRLEKGQTAKQKIFEYIKEENRSSFQNNPTFKITKVQIYTLD